MKGEIPMFRRCCCCLPLRYGLLAWGYFKIVANALLISFRSFNLIHIIMYINLYANEDFIGRMYTILVLSVIVITLCFTDIIVTIVFIVGGHKKNVKLIRVFYFMSMGMWMSTFLLACVSIITSIQDYFTYPSNIGRLILHNFLMSIGFYFLALVVQTYFLLLLRSEIIKLRNNGEFRFVNNATEAACTMQCEETVVGAETVEQDA